MSCCYEFFSSFLFFVGAVGGAGRDLRKVNHSAVSNKSTGTEGSDTSTQTLSCRATARLSFKGRSRMNRHCVTG